MLSDDIDQEIHSLYFQLCQAEDEGDIETVKQLEKELEELENKQDESENIENNSEMYDSAWGKDDIILAEIQRPDLY